MFPRTGTAQPTPRHVPCGETPYRGFSWPHSPGDCTSILTPTHPHTERETMYKRGGKEKKRDVGSSLGLNIVSVDSGERREKEGCTKQTRHHLCTHTDERCVHGAAAACAHVPRSRRRDLHLAETRQLVDLLYHIRLGLVRVEQVALVDEHDGAREKDARGRLIAAAPVADYITRKTRASLFGCGAGYYL